MALEVPHKLVEFILLGPEDDRRQLQDSPILGDVWLAYAKNPDQELELLITPYKDNAAVTVALELARALGADDAKSRGTAAEVANIAYLHGIVAARLSFRDVLRVIVPLTYWWNDRKIADAIGQYAANPGSIKVDMMSILKAASTLPNVVSERPMQDIATHARYVTLAGIILWAQDQKGKKAPAVATLIKRLMQPATQEAIVRKLRATLSALRPPPLQPTVWYVARNRRASAALIKSVPSVKADSARSLFTVRCSDLVWAVVDSGIYAQHEALRDASGNSRVRRAFDFTQIREVISLDNAFNPKKRDAAVDKLLTKRHGLLKNPPSEKEARELLARLSQDAAERRATNWALVESLIEIKPEVPPRGNHGTHVAGILAADKHKGQRPDPAAAAAAALASAGGDWADGMCPDIQLYDFRVLAPDLAETEFAIIAALQYIRHINERNTFMTIHGANLSLSIQHDVRNYACGRTPVCNECERLVNSGVVVVAAAGNRGYQNFQTTDGLYEGYAAFSVTDPGNADGVITVGSTHRYWPHTYGVSFFSSRGPTGDGRMKPDLVAPGERIRAPLADGRWGDLDGTSMAAPHVSGAAAMLMARYSELVGQPRRIKQILCSTATDLGREKSFQGHGMLDVLRAFQSI
jgi:hypothetical protein